MDSHTLCKMHWTQIILVLLSVCGSMGQDIQLGATWIPTDLNYGVLTNLRQNQLQTNSEQIAGYSTLGIIPSDTVKSWLQQLIGNPSFREGTVRWAPNDPSKCSSGRAGCTKSIRITVLEFDYIDPNATDCNTTALVAADALLPPQAVFSSSNTQYWPQGPIQYQITRAPNSTAGNCTYVVQYPPPTQTLANLLCSQQAGSCFNSGCVPCNANQTIATDSNPSGCTRTSGVAPALVAAIEGAAQCLVSGGVGAFQCQVAYIANASACSQMHCFPGDAKIVLEGSRSIQMQDVKIGDRVQVMDANGELTYDDVYFFGHRSTEAVGSFVRLTLGSRHSASSLPQKVLELSAKHFLPVGQSGGDYRQATMKQARDVVPGDLVFATQGNDLQAQEVTDVTVVSKQGLWAPYTSRGTIVVNGVVASVHSEWILDGLLETLGRPDLLPAIYQALLAPVRILYKLMGASAFQKLDARLDFGEILTSPHVSSARHTLFLAAVILFMFPLGQRMGKTFAKRLSQPQNDRTRAAR